MSDRYLVIGNPVHQSKSPFIHAEFAQMCGQDIVYDRYLVEADQFDHTVIELFSQDLKGANITVPFKENAYRLADEHSVRAATAGAANTLKKLSNGKLYADNTDGAGLVRDLTANHQISLTGKRILMLGAGGAVRGVLHPVLQQNPEQIVISNRTVEKATLLAKLFSEYGSIEGSPYEALSGHFDLIINGTSASLHDQVPPVPESLIHGDIVCYDMMYGSGDTRFNAWAKSLGAAKCIDGLGMLVEQAAESFQVWREVTVTDTSSVIDKLRASL
ncbi:shikimate dehydrogenase [Gynuella sunshinyii]|uniref:Shikimate dehydrogenase (NADP(+)) n=1 Tax=Gynuella sunshinyii YC6258 TaxID=1445510 RepID=A0A0C5VDQ0_9GAMM|nr:shikimate dehydrogenase [Gynuella sunshinyii]AJQ92652.1 shikimate 5-dehydrogenase [Gynuella sunshinyii YC6258]